MRKTLCMTAMLLGAVALPCLATAEVETFGGLTGESPISGASTLTGGTVASAFGPPDISLETTGALPALADGQYISYTGATDEEITFEFTAIPNSSGTVYVALALRVDAISGTVGNNRADILRVQEIGGNLFGLVVRDGVVRMADSNGWGATRVLYNDINDFGTGTWRIIAGRVDQSIILGDARAKWWALDATTGVETVLYDDVANNTSTGNTGVGDIDLIQFGATYALPVATATDFGISIDDVTIRAGADFASESAFLDAVRAYYTSANVSDWSTY